MQDRSLEFCSSISSTTDPTIPLDGHTLDDHTKTKEQLIHELANLRQQVADLQVQRGDAAIHVLDRITDGFLVLDRQGRLIYINAYTETIIHRSRHDLIGKVLWDEYPALVDTLIYQKYCEALETGTAVHFETFDPVVGRWWEIHAYPDATGLSIFFQDIDPRKQIEVQQQSLLTELMEWQSRYEVMGQVSSQILYEWNLTTDRTTWGANTERILGYASTEMPEDLCSRLAIIHPSDRSTVRHLVEQAIHDRVPFQAEYRLRHKAGHYIWVIDKCQFALNSAGTCDRVIGFIADIHERKQTEQTLRENEKIFQQIIENIQEVFYVSTLDHTQILYVNPVYEQIWGRSREGLYCNPNSWLDAVHPEDRNRIVVALERQLRGEPFCQQYRIIRPDGSIRWIADRTTLIQDEAGQFYRLTGIAEDVTERRYAEAALQEVIEFNQQLVANVQEGVIVYGRDFQYLLWNRAMEEMSGLHAKTVLGKRPLDVFPFLEETGIYNFLTRAMAGETVVSPDMYFYIPETGKSGWASTKFSPFRDTRGNTLGVIAIVHDITCRKQAELALKHRIQFEQLLTQLSIQFINLKLDEIDTSIQRGLQAIGEFAKVDWVWIYLYSENDMTVTKAYEWVAPGVTSPLENIQAVSNDAFAWSIAKMRQSQPIYVSDLSELPDEAEVERSSAQAIGTKSFLAVPMTHQGNLIGSMGFHTFRSSKQCSAEDIDLFTTLGTLFASTILRKRSETSNHAIIRAIPDLLIRFNREGIYLELVNAGNIKLSKPAEACLGKTLYDILPHDLAEQRMHYIQQAFETGELQVYDYELEVDGEILYEEARIVVSGENEALLIVRDITDRKRAEMALKLQAERESDLCQQLQIANRELHRLAAQDGLTQVANRRRFDEYIRSQWHHLKRDQFPLTLILCDVDNFKRYNDRYGHQAGDSCLQQIAQAIQRSTKRSTDLVARYGGEEFAIILLNTDAEGAVCIAQAIQAEIAQLQIPHDSSLVSQFVTLSIGIASTIPTQTTSLEALIAAADQALYDAKSKGRNQYCMRQLS